MLRTDVDEFLDLIRQKGRISLQDAAKSLKIPISTIQAWVDFLVEEKIVGIEYKFTTPYVFMNVEQNEKAEFRSAMQFDTKEEFYAKAQHRGLNAGQIKLLWLKYLNLNKNYMMKTFFEKSQERGINKAKAEALWSKYMDYLEGGD
jgi:hypothetical protein